jgi:uncharacterized protein involved in exopolysaccharide biosynthesis
MSNPIREETTNRDATHEWIRAELAKARAELVALHARMAATGRSVEIYRAEARDLGKAELDQQDLLRVAKTAEENFLLYSRKQEEARISDELDKRKFLNVSVAEEATPPVFPSSPNWPLNLFLGGLLACFASIGLALTADYVDRSFRTPAEVELVLDVPVLAYLPKH